MSNKDPPDCNKQTKHMIWYMDDGGSPLILYDLETEPWSEL